MGDPRPLACVCVRGTWLVLTGLFMAVFAGGPAQAQAVARESFRADRFTAPPTSEDGITLAYPEPLGHLEASALVVSRYALSEFVLNTPSERTLIQHRVMMDVVAALGLFSVIELYARLPTVLFTRGDNAVFELVPLAAPAGSSLGDMAVGITGGGRLSRGVSLGARAEAILPTGSVANLASDRAVEPHAEVLASWSSSRLTLSALLGATFREARDYASVHIGPELKWGGGLKVRVDASVEALVEGVGTRVYRAREELSASDGFELLVGGRKRLRLPLVEATLGAAVGAGLSDLAGEPAFRALFTFGVAQRNGSAADSLAALVDLDQDHDGIPDAADRCPREHEDLDGYQDEDGCPDLDNDGDGKRDADDACPDEPSASADGCPSDDLDQDGVPDSQDLCPRDPEDHDGDRDEDGCPDLDSDGDGLTDDQDSCPDVPGLPEKQGCLAHARLERSRIVLLTPIVFDMDNVFIARSSAPVLDDVAALLRARPRLAAVLRVQLAKRPTPDGGLVMARAQASLLLQALVARGVERERLEVEPLLQSAGATDRVEIFVRAHDPQP